MASKKSASTLSSFKSMITEAVQDIDTHLKAAGYDILNKDKDSGARCLEKVRRKVRILEIKSVDIINQLEKEKEEDRKQQKVSLKRQQDLVLENKRMMSEVKRLKEDLDDTFPDSDISFGQSQDDNIQPSSSQTYDSALSPSDGKKELH